LHPAGHSSSRRQQDLLLLLAAHPNPSQMTCTWKVFPLPWNQVQPGTTDPRSRERCDRLLGTM
ncbi:MAG: hypothetical protein M3Q71_03840, partial [Chloroflexota bacterium]|nr:hypothetical protein [Chloroflexota bacterium]